jgi:hypothetical protein
MKYAMTPSTPEEKVKVKTEQAAGFFAVNNAGNTVNMVIDDEAPRNWAAVPAPEITQETVDYIRRQEMALRARATLDAPRPTTRLRRAP